MEILAIVGVVLGLLIGLAMGVIVVQLRASRGRSKLESEVALVNQRLEFAEEDNRELREQTQALQTQDSESKQESSSLRAQLEASNKGLEIADRGNEGLIKQTADLQAEATASKLEAAELRAQLEATNKRLEEQLNLEKLMADKFRALSAEAISDNSDRFLKGANEKIETLVKPLSDELKRIEINRAESQGSLIKQIETLVENNKSLEQEARNLSTALRRPEVRGSWGEIHLRRVVELAGMSDYCDFEEQVSVPSLNGSQDRPDMVVRMPSERIIVIDAKTPLDAYLAAAESKTDEERRKALEKHAGQVKERAQDLSRKGYQESFDKSPEFVVMYLPGEFFLQPALEKDPKLLDWAMERGVIIATPNTLMALLKTVEMGWREVRLARDAVEIAKLGKEMHDRIETWASHMVNIGNSLGKTVEHFNKGIGSLESRVLISARRFKELGVWSSQEIPEIPTVDTQVRELNSFPSSSGQPALPAGREEDPD